MVKLRLDCDTDLGKKGYNSYIDKNKEIVDCKYAHAQASNIIDKKVTISQLEDAERDNQNIRNRMLDVDRKPWSQYSNLLYQDSKLTNVRGIPPLDINTSLGKKGYDIYKGKMDLFEDPTNLQNRVNELDQNFFLALESFKDSFVRYIQNPKYVENKKIYVRDKDAIINYEQLAFTLDNDIQKNFDKVNVLVKDQDLLNKQAKKLSLSLSSENKSLDSSDSSTSQMIDDKEYEYKIVYSKCGLFLAGSIGLFVYILRSLKTNSN